LGNRSCDIARQSGGFLVHFVELWITFLVVFFVNDFNGLTPESMKMLIYRDFYWITHASCG
jgi:hypothetical protein